VLATSGSNAHLLYAYFADPSDTDLRHALANMIAVVFALPSHSNHIWYHMFCPGELEGSHMTGFMVHICTYVCTETPA